MSVAIANSAAARLLQECASHGVAATLTVKAPDYSASTGAVSGTQASATANVFGPVDEAKRYAREATDTNVTCTFYVPASGLTVTPATGMQIAVGSRAWRVYAVQPYELTGVRIGWRLDCGEVASG